MIVKPRKQTYTHMHTDDQQVDLSYLSRANGGAGGISSETQRTLIIDLSYSFVCPRG